MKKASRILVLVCVLLLVPAVVAGRESSIVGVGVPGSAEHPEGGNNQRPSCS